MSLNKNSQSCERQRGCFFAENFLTRASVEENNGTVYGAPTFGGKVILDGTTDRLEYNIASPAFPDQFSCFMKFVPYFDADANNLRRLYHTTSGFSVMKLQNALADALRIVMDGIIIADIPYATYSPYWKIGEINTLSITSRSGDTDVWLNDAKVLNNDNSAWTFSSLGDVCVGGTYGGGGLFKGEIHEFRMFDRQLQGGEARDYNANAVFDYRGETVLDLPMLIAQHDNPNNQTLDISGNANHAVWTPGVTQPLKNKLQPGYLWDGVDDVMSIASSASNTFGDGTTDSPFSISYWVRADTFGAARSVYKRDPAGNAEYQLGASGNKIFFNCFDDSTGGYIGRTNASYDLSAYAGQWVHIVGTYDGSSTNGGMKFYVNGLRQDTTNSTAGAYTAMENTGQSINLGQYSTGFLSGSMAFIKIFESELTQMQATDLYTRETILLNRY
jgi:hypothetical protein